MAGKKLPAFQFYPGDWLKDPALRSVSVAARGLWIDMLCLMHESPRRGYLQHATGKPVTAEQLARMTGCSTDEVSRLLQELEDTGVFSCTEHGVIFSRRMVRDEAKRQRCREAGTRGGNPLLKSRTNGDLGQTLNRPSKGDAKGHSKGHSKGGAKGQSNPNPTPSFSSSFSSSSSSSNRESSPSFNSSGNGESKGLEKLMNDCTETKVCSEIGRADSPPSPAESHDQAGVPEEVARLTFPCEGKTKEWRVTSNVYQSLREAFRTIDIDAEILKAYAWLVSNPAKLKTAKGMPRFLFNWLSRAVDSGRGPPRGPDATGNFVLSDLERRNLEATKLWLAQKEQQHAN